MGTGFHLPVKSGSFYIQMVEISGNGKNILRSEDVCWIYCR